MSVGWRAEIGAEWNASTGSVPDPGKGTALPVSFISTVSKPIDLNKSWPSAYADDGRVFWSRATSGVDGTLNVTFPDIRWKYLRATEGWASLQHHSLLHTTLTIYPPSGDEALPGFRFHLVQGSYFTILPTDDTRESYVPEWYMGNIYDFQDALPRIVSLPSPPSLDIPTRYDIFVSGDYEIRLFGDPNVRGSDTPELVIRMTVDIEQVDDPIVHEPSQDVLCDFVDGIPFGNVLGIALRSRKGGWTVSSVSGLAETSLALISGQKYTIAPGQTRIVPLLANNRRLGEQMIGPELMLAVNLVSDTSQRRVMLIKLPINHVTHWEQNLHKPIIGTYMYESSMPTAFVAVPPASKSELGSAPPILALHGAGVEALKDPFWVEALPRRDTNWYIVPQGRTSWGLDWHGPSAKDAWTAVDALHDILIGVDEWQEWQIQEKSKVIIMGHSNGGQGAWYIAARYPDRVVAVIPAAAYVKSQAYISLHMSRAGHFIDPALRAILETSLTPDDNDLHLSNLKDIPVLAIHGGSDENVPVWHSRQLVDILDSQNNHSVARFREVEGQPHFWPEVFQNDEVENFLDKFSSKSNSRSGDGPEEFTLTVASPQESGSLQGFRVESLAIPGRLGRLRVKVDGNGGVNVETVNIRSFSVQRKPSFWASMNVDRFSLPAHFFADTSRVYLTKPSSSKSDTWKLSTVSDQTPHRYQAPSRLQGILLSGGPVGIVYANDLERGSSAAVRIAHDLFLYHKLDSYVMSETDAEERLKHSSLKEGNLVYIGKPSSALARSILSEGRTAFSSGGSHLSIGGRDLSDPTIGAVFLHPHPDMTQPQNSMMFMLAYNNVGLERALRLFPIRTGVPAPSWVVSSERADAQGAGGIIGAGVWTGDWQWQEALSLQQY